MATSRPRSYDNTWAGVASAAKAAGALYPELVAAQWALPLLCYGNSGL